LYEFPDHSFIENKEKLLALHTENLKRVFYISMSHLSIHQFFSNGMIHLMLPQGFPVIEKNGRKTFLL